MPPPSVSPPTPVVEMMPPVVARPNGYPAAFMSPQVAPPSTRAVWVSGSTRTPRMVERSTTRASSAVPNPGTLCDPPRTATVRSFSAANRTAVITSPVLAGRTITAGRRSIMALYTRRASSYSASSAVVTVPRTFSRRAVSAFVSIEQILASSFHWSQTSGPEVATCRRDPQRCVNGIGIHARPARVDMAGPLDQSRPTPCRPGSTLPTPTGALTTASTATAGMAVTWSREPPVWRGSHWVALSA